MENGYHPALFPNIGYAMAMGPAPAHVPAFYNTLQADGNGGIFWTLTHQWETFLALNHRFLLACLKFLGWFQLHLDYLAAIVEKRRILDRGILGPMGVNQAAAYPGQSFTNLFLRHLYVVTSFCQNLPAEAQAFLAWNQRLHESNQIFSDGGQMYLDGMSDFIARHRRFPYRNQVRPYPVPGPGQNYNGRSGPAGPWIAPATPRPAPAVLFAPGPALPARGACLANFRDAEFVPLDAIGQGAQAFDGLPLHRQAGLVPVATPPALPLAPQAGQAMQYGPIPYILAELLGRDGNPGVAQRASADGLGMHPARPIVIPDDPEDLAEPQPAPLGKRAAAVPGFPPRVNPSELGVVPPNGNVVQKTAAGRNDESTMSKKEQAVLPAAAAAMTRSGHTYSLRQRDQTPVETSSKPTLPTLAQPSSVDKSAGSGRPKRKAADMSVTTGNPRADKKASVASASDGEGEDE